MSSRFIKHKFSKAEQILGTSRTQDGESYWNESSSDSYVAQIKSKISPFYNKGKLILTLQVLFFAWLALGAVQKFQFTDNDDARFQHLRNQECSIDTIRGNGDPNDLCDLTTNQYSKFVMILVDSLAYDQAEKHLQMFKGTSNLHKVMHYGFKFSTAIYTSYFTGKIPTNYAGHEIVSDSIFHQFRQADMRVQFVGPRFPTLTLLGSSAHSVFTKIQEVVHEDKTFEILRKPEGDSLLKDIALNGNSVFLTTNVLDDGIHKTGKLDPKNHVIVDQLEDILIKLKRFVDEHPDYLFMFVSDHGGSLTGGQHEGQLHGVPDNGNEAWVLFYNPNLVPLMNQGTWLDTVDVASTIAKYFKGVNIPMESVGKVAPNNDNLMQNYKVVKSNVLQLKHLADLKHFSYDMDLFQSAISDPDIPIAIEKMNQFIVSIKKPLIDFKRFPLSELVYLGAIIIFIQLYLIKVEFKSIRELLQYFKYDLVLLVIPHVYLWLDLMFLKFDYFKDFTSMFNYHTILFAICLVRAVFMYYSDSRDRPPSDVLMSTSASNNSSSSVITGNMKPSDVGGRLIILYSCWGVVRLYFAYLQIDSLPLSHLLCFALLSVEIVYLLHNTKADQILDIKYLRRDTIYLGVIALIYLYEWSNNAYLIMQLAYLAIFADLLYCLFVDPNYLVYPVVVLLFALETSDERIFLLLVLVPSFHTLSELFREIPGSDFASSESKAWRSLRKILLLVAVNFAYDSYCLMDGQFNMNVVVRAGGVGVLNVEYYPTFSGFLMAYHKFGYYFVLVSFLARMMSYDKQKFSTEVTVNNASQYYQQVPSGIYLFYYMFLKSAVLLWTFHLAFWLYKDYLTCWVMAMITSLVTGCYGFVLVCHQILVDIVPSVLKLVQHGKGYISRQKRDLFI